MKLHKVRGHFYILNRQIYISPINYLISHDVNDQMRRVLHYGRQHPGLFKKFTVLFSENNHVIKAKGAELEAIDQSTDILQGMYWYKAN